MAIHVLEHFYRWDVPAVLAEWLRLLKKGGQLTLELPDIKKCAQNLLAGADYRMSYWGIYGDPKHADPYMCHRWGWTPETLWPVLHEAGFHDVKSEIPQWHKRGAEMRDMRMTARRP